MPRPVMKMVEYEQRVLLEVWLVSGGDFHLDVDGNACAITVTELNPGVPLSWRSVGLDSLIAQGYIEVSPDHMSDSGIVRLTRKGLIHAENIHNTIAGYKQWELDKRFSNERFNAAPFIAGSAVASHSAASSASPFAPFIGAGDSIQRPPRRNRGAFVLGRSIIGRDILRDPKKPRVREQSAVELQYEGPDILSADDSAVIDLRGNRQQWDRFSADLRSIGEAIRTRNEWLSDEQREEGLRVQRELVAGADLIEGDTADRNKLRGLLESGLKWAGKSFADGIVKELAKRTFDLFVLLVLRGLS